MVLLPGPGDRLHAQPTPPGSASISRPTTPPQAFQPPPPVPPRTLPPAEAEELRQLRLQFQQQQQQQQQQAAHHLQQQALFQSSFNPFFPPFQLYFPSPSLPLATASPPNPPSDPPPASVPPSAPEPAPVAPEPADLSISLFTSQAATQPPASTQAASTHRSPDRSLRPETPPRLSLQWSRHRPDFTSLEHSAKLVYLMDNIMEIAIDLGPQKHIWTTPFWLHIRPTGPADLWHEI